MPNLEYGIKDRGGKLSTTGLQPSTNLNIENTLDTLPTFSTCGGDSRIDLLISKNLKADISLEITDEIPSSDHNIHPNSRKISLKAINWIHLKLPSTG
ncbi:hypothetical protein CDAR_259311 [Caerostris darwini]|uniref:Uncharacterized protein n=1 Tax=Caerostris darwini TaxID=1538125 RepID=A0AAV4WU21_9ARAC|nr:hypothetical protein CDAR_259311 [Caerostris darwini]